MFPPGEKRELLEVQQEQIDMMARLSVLEKQRDVLIRAARTVGRL